MEISLSPELMAVLQKLVDTFGAVQRQYLVALIPTVLMFVFYMLIVYRPSTGGLKVWWYIRRLEKKTNATVISLVHKQPKKMFDIFKVPMITLDDSNAILKALKEIPNNRVIYLILHTPGGMVIAAEQIARAIKARAGVVEAFIPQYAMSGGSLIALACDKIHLGDSALLGPLDPQLIVGMFDQYPCASLLKALKVENANRDDRTLVYGDVAEKAIKQMKITVEEILEEKYGTEKAKKLACQLCDGNYTHDYGIDLMKAKALGLDVDNDMPEEIYKVGQTYSAVVSVSYRKPKNESSNYLRIGL